jgi:hypothetical protein
MRKLATLISFFLVISSTFSQEEIYADLLLKYTGEDGNLNYKGFISEKEKFEQYLHYLSNNPPKKNSGINERMAYWINAYNAFTIKLIIDNYPLESITDLHPFFYIPGFNTVWQEEFFKIGGEDFDLDRIEHDILRKEFNEPRIHFAINCASKSCPKLRNEPYTAEKLEEQLESQCIEFLKDKSKNRISEDELYLSRIFSWFSDDFGDEEGIKEFIRIHLKMNVSQGAKVSYLSYDWSLNE